MDENLKNELAGFAKVMGDVGRQMAEASDNLINFLGAPHLSESEGVYNKLPWKERTSSSGRPMEVVGQTDVSGEQTKLWTNLKNTIAAGVAESEKRKTYSEKAWSYYYWLSQDGSAIFRRKKKRS